MYTILDPLRLWFLYISYLVYIFVLQTRLKCDRQFISDAIIVLQKCTMLEKLLAFLTLKVTIWLFLCLIYLKWLQIEKNLTLVLSSSLGVAATTKIKVGKTKPKICETFKYHHQIPRFHSSEQFPSRVIHPGTVLTSNFTLILATEGILNWKFSGYFLQKIYLLVSTYVH